MSGVRAQGQRTGEHDGLVQNVQLGQRQGLDQRLHASAGVHHPSDRVHQLRRQLHPHPHRKHVHQLRPQALRLQRLRAEPLARAHETLLRTADRGVPLGPNQDLRLQVLHHALVVRLLPGLERQNQVRVDHFDETAKVHRTHHQQLPGSRGQAVGCVLRPGAKSVDRRGDGRVSGVHLGPGQQCHLETGAGHARLDHCLGPHQLHLCSRRG
mmetsp:Transcript_103036/g.222457  ORF Transcript_103036/g.222457 Transcript_103036/m.222457 type:complete len:211 (-) Transcript_103036:1381-2013(-)